ncbi:MAG TPA: SRPBCC domain-containing protein, partial [Gemmatimonadaceae bacterium]
MQTGSEINFSRVLDAPRALVFQVWTDPIHFANWWGPHHFTNPVCELDVRPGGALKVEMRGPDGTSHTMLGEFKELDYPGKLSFTTMLGEKSAPIFETLVTVNFGQASKATTKLDINVRILHMTPEAAPFLAGMNEGWQQQMERLGAHVKHTREHRATVHGSFTIQRDFNAPVSRVFKAFTTVEAKKKWFFGPDGWDSGGHTMDFRVGGWEHESGGPPGGPVHHFHAIYRDIVPDERIIYSYDMQLDEWQISVSLATLEFRKNGTGTTLVLTEQGV